MADRRLLLLYVANETMHMTYGKGWEYVKSFGEALTDCVEALVEYSSGATKT